MARRLKRALTLPSTISIAALLALLVLGFIALRLGEASQPAMPTRGEFGAILHRAGLEPEAMAAVGITPTQTTAAIAAVREELPQLAASLRAADLALAEASREQTRLQKLVRSGKATPEERQTLQSVKAQVQTATETRDAVVRSVVNLAAPEIGQQAAAALDMVRGNMRQGLPLIYRVVEREERQALVLRSALAAKRIHTRLNEPVPTEATAAITAADAAPAVVAARLNLQNDREAVAQAWRHAVEGE